MPLSEQAKIFAPFAALRGHSDRLSKETGKLMKSEKIELSEEEAEILSGKLMQVNLPDLDAVLLIGLCTDICVISNALLLKAALPEVRICVDAGCCAGVTPESHKNALAAMETCQIDIRKDRSIGSSSL